MADETVSSSLVVNLVSLAAALPKGSEPVVAEVARGIEALRAQARKRTTPSPPPPSPPVDPGDLPAEALDVIAGQPARMSRRQAWTALGISKTELDRLLRARVIPSQREGRRVLILRLDVAAYVARQAGYKA